MNMNGKSRGRRGRRSHAWSGGKVHVTEYALIRRVNRLLKTMPLKGHGQCRLLKTRENDTEKRQQLGVFYVVDDKSVVQTHLDLEQFARDRGALAIYEALA
jgi:hypothetical protein